MDNFDKLFKIPFFTMKLNGSSPYRKKDKVWLVHFLLLHTPVTLVFFLIIYNIACINLKSNDFTRTCKNGVLIIVYLVLLIQYFALSYYCTPIRSLIEDVKNDFAKYVQPEEQKIMPRYVIKGIWVCRQWAMIGFLGSGLFFVKGWILMVYYYVIGEFHWVRFYELTYPDNIEPYAVSGFFYWVDYVVVAMFSIVSAFMYISFVPLGPIFMLHACGQLELIKQKINHLFDDCNDEVVMEKLRDIIAHLQHIYNFVDRINGCFQVVYEVILKATSITLPVASYQLIEGIKSNSITVEFITFIVGTVSMSCTPCYYSEVLQEMGEEFRLSLYFSRWELEYSRRTRTTLLIMMTRAMQPIAISTVFRTLNLEAVTDMFRQSYAIFSLMNAMWE